MRPPVLYYATCPHCGLSSGISVLSAGRYYLADEGWLCPNCDGFSTTSELHEKTDAMKADKDSDHKRDTP